MKNISSILLKNLWLLENIFFFLVGVGAYGFMSVD